MDLFHAMKVFNKVVETNSFRLAADSLGLPRASVTTTIQALEKHLQHAISFITLSEHGVYFGKSDAHKLIPTHIRNIADVSGAGDTVIAVASLTYASTKNMELAAELANIAGGLVCELVGTAPINRANLQAEVKNLLVK